jgi:hypothetical protein
MDAINTAATYVSEEPNPDTLRFPQGARASSARAQAAALVGGAGE